MTRPARTRAGFTLIELMIAMFVGVIGVAAAVNVAQSLTRHNAKGRQKTSTFSRNLLLGRQLRSDLRVSGIGSSGAVAVDPAFNGMGALASQTPSSGLFAISVVAGANNLSGVALGASRLLPGSDALQILVPNPTTGERTTALAPSGSNVLTFLDAGRLATCPMVYLVDQSAPTGVGRSMIAFVSSANAGSLTLHGAMPFSVAGGSQVMCARLSTYWLDDSGYLHRTDLSPNPTLVRLSPSFPVFVDAAAVAAAEPTSSDVVAPGVLDLQIAYRVSSEAYRLAGVAVPIANMAAQWGFAGAPPGSRSDEALLAGPSSWFEVRLVRVNLLTRTLRKIEESDSARQYPRVEDGGAATPPTITLPWNHAAEWTTVTEALANLRYFDLSAPEGTPAEPY